MHLEYELRKRHLALFVGSIAVLVAIAATPQLLGDRVADGFDGLAAAEASWLWLAGLAFGGSLLASASGWASALTRCGGETTRFRNRFLKPRDSIRRLLKWKILRPFHRTHRSRVINTPDTPTPEVQFLSNGKYHVMMTNAGGGYSRWKEMAVTRWREDSTCDNWGISVISGTSIQTSFGRTPINPP